jgi:hypothetical protein
VKGGTSDCAGTDVKWIKTLTEIFIGDVAGGFGPVVLVGGGIETIPMLTTPLYTSINTEVADSRDL